MCSGLLLDELKREWLGKRAKKGLYIRLKLRNGRIDHKKEYTGVINMTKILIVNFFSRLNKGSAALLNAKINLLKDLRPMTTFVVSTHHPEIDYTQYNVKMVKVSGKAYPLTFMAGKLVLSALCVLDLVLNKYFGVRIKLSIRGRRVQEYASQSTAKSHAEDSLESLLTLFLLFRCGFWAMLHRFGLNVNRSFCGKKLQEYYDADIILNTGGDCLTEDYGSPFLHFVFGHGMDQLHNCQKLSL